MRHITNFLDWFTDKFLNPYNVIPYGYCPIQAEGNLSDGATYYFRARGNHWSLEVSPPNRFWWPQNKGVFVYEEGYGTEEFAAGCMSSREAIKFATKGINRYFETK